MPMQFSYRGDDRSMATAWTKPVARKVSIKTGDGELDVVAILDETGVLLRKAGHQKTATISYAELLAKLPK